MNIYLFTVFLPAYLVLFSCETTPSVDTLWRHRYQNMFNMKVLMLPVDMPAYSIVGLLTTTRNILVFNESLVCFAIIFNTYVLTILSDFYIWRLFIQVMNVYSFFLYLFKLFVNDFIGVMVQKTTNFFRNEIDNLLFWQQRKTSK